MYSKNGYAILKPPLAEKAMFSRDRRWQPVMFVCLFLMVPSCKYHHCSPIYSVPSMCRKDLATKLVRSSTKLSFFCFATGDVASRLVRSLARNWPVPWLLCYLRAGLDCIMKLLRWKDLGVHPCQHCCLFFKFGRLAKFIYYVLLLHWIPDVGCCISVGAWRTRVFSPGTGPKKPASKQNTSFKCTHMPAHTQFIAINRSKEKQY